MLLATVLGMSFTTAGLATSYQPDLPAGATTILIAGATYLISLLVTSLARARRPARGRPSGMR
jgi:zinc transport system permease protein